MAHTVQRENLHIPQGSTYKHVFHYRDADGNVIPLSGYTARMQIRETVQSADYLFAGDTDDGTLTIDGPNGDVILEIHGNSSSPWAFRRGVYDIEIISPSGKPTRIVKGKIQVDPEVTR